MGPVPFLYAASTAMSVLGDKEYNKSLKEDAKAAAADAMFTAEQLEINAKAVEAQGTRSAYFMRKKGETIASDARASMAAGGGSASDAGAIDRIADIDAATDYNVLATLYDSRRRSEGMKAQAGAKRREAAAARKAAKKKKRSSIGTVISGAASIFGASE